MNVSNKTLKVHTATITIVGGLVLLLIYFKVSPQIMDAFRETSEIQIGTIENRLSLVMIGYFIFAFLINAFVWKVENKMAKEEAEIQILLKINPRASDLQARLQKVQKQKQACSALIDPLLMIVLGLIVGFIVWVL